MPNVPIVTSARTCHVPAVCRQVREIRADARFDTHDAGCGDAALRGVGYGARPASRPSRHRKAIAVEVTGASEPVLCAEKDNVTVNLTSKEVRRFTIEAVHPAYIGTMQRDSFEADWTGCTAPGDPRPDPTATEPPKRITLYEEYDLWVVGQVYPSFWRPATATVRIGDRVEKGLHLVQVWLRRPMGGEEVLVLYPQDGYWRLRPRAPSALAPTAFGSSFLLGPVEVDERPLVRIREVAFDPKIAHLHAELSSAAALRPSPWPRSTRPGMCWTWPSTRPSPAGRSPRCAPCT